MTANQFAAACVRYCTETRASETSGFRTPSHNASVGGKSDSPHLLARARDVVYDDTPTAAERHRIAALCGLALIIEPTHDHLQPPDWPAA